jgi:electron transport complex protein RnfG
MNPRDLSKVTINLVAIYVIGGLLLAGLYGYTSPIIFKNRKEDKEAALRAMMPIHLKMKLSDSAEDKVRNALGEGVSVVRVDAGGGLIELDAEVDVYKKKMKKLLKKLRKAGATEVEQYSDYETRKAGDWELWHKHAEYFEAVSGDVLEGYIVESYGKGYSSYPNVYVTLDRDYRVRKLAVLSHGETPGLGDEIEKDWYKDQYIGKDLEHLEVIKGETADKIQAITGATITTRAVTDAVRDAITMLKEGPTEEAGGTSEVKDEH